MQVSFDVESHNGNIFRVILSSGKDAFFATDDVVDMLGIDVEIVEIDLERIKGEENASVATLYKIAEGIANFFANNSKAILYYYCDDLQEIPLIGAHNEQMWPQEYRSLLFSKLFQRFVSHYKGFDSLIDVDIVIYQDTRPIFMHLIAREEHVKYIETIKQYISLNYGK